MIIGIMIMAAVPIIIHFCCEKKSNNTKNRDVKNEAVMGVWWWNNKLDSNLYLNFANENGINEIYYCSSEFGEETGSFISSANKLGIKVYLLQGEYEWLDDSSSLFEKIEKYRKYQTDYPDSKFSGIHLDIEPHQNPEFKNKREDLILKLIELANLLKTTYSDITFDYDIPFWLDDNIMYNNSSCPAYQHMIDIADRVFVMSYRDSSDSIISVASDELNYAKAINKTLILSVECSSDEGDKVSFAEEGRAVLKNELTKIKQMFNSDVGISIHHIKSWYDMKE